MTSLHQRRTSIHNQKFKRFNRSTQLFKILIKETELSCKNILSAVYVVFQNGKQRN